MLRQYFCFPLVFVDIPGVSDLSAAAEADEGSSAADTRSARKLSFSSSFLGSGQHMS